MAAVLAATNDEDNYLKRVSTPRKEFFFDQLCSL